MEKQYLYFLQSRSPPPALIPLLRRCSPSSYFPLTEGFSISFTAPSRSGFTPGSCPPRDMTLSAAVLEAATAPIELKVGLAMAVAGMGAVVAAVIGGGAIHRHVGSELVGARGRSGVAADAARLWAGGTLGGSASLRGRA